MIYNFEIIAEFIGISKKNYLVMKTRILCESRLRWNTYRLWVDYLEIRIGLFRVYGLFTLKLGLNYFEIRVDYLESRGGYGWMKIDIVVDNKRYRGR